MPSVPRFFEKFYAAIMSGVEGAPPLKRKIFHWSLRVGRRVSQLQREKRPLPLGLRLKRRIANRLVFKKLQARMGGRLKFFISGAAPLSKHIAEFFHALGVLILEGYGLTETCPALTLNRPEKYKFGTVGPPLPGVEIKIDEDGEILGRGANVVSGYFNRPDATKEAFPGDGWFRTGDIGKVDEDGFVHITDRKKDLIITAGGKNLAPQIIETQLKKDPLVSQVIMIGDKKPYCVALISLNAEELKKLAEGQGVGELPPEELARRPEIRERIQNTVDEVNADLASYETIKKFALLPKDFTQEAGELTPTLKPRRHVIMKKYADQIEQLYGP
jgi:long-chain acyl-CoA synthetase